MMKNDAGNLKNPYTRLDIPKDIVRNIRGFIRLSHALKEPINLTLKKNDEKLNHKKKTANKTLSIFHRIDTFGHITDTSWFLNLERMHLIRFIRELQDIWNYRATLTPQVKREICPPNGNPFHRLHHANTVPIITRTKEMLQRNSLYIMERLISRGIDTDSKALGAFYILSALTLVSHNAAVAMPWLYESVVHNQ